MRPSHGSWKIPVCPQVINTIFQELEALGDDTQSLQTVSLVQVGQQQEQGMMSWDESPKSSLPLPRPCCAKGTNCPVLASSALIQRGWRPLDPRRSDLFPRCGKPQLPTEHPPGPSSTVGTGEPSNPFLLLSQLGFLGQALLTVA